MAFWNRALHEALESSVREAESLRAKLALTQETSVRWEAIATERTSQIAEFRERCAAAEARAAQSDARLVEKLSPAPEQQTQTNAIAVPLLRKHPNRRKALSEILDKFDSETLEARKRELTPAKAKSPIAPAN